MKKNKISEWYEALSENTKRERRVAAGISHEKKTKLSYEIPPWGGWQ
jgi:hypothetical protein